MMTVDVRHLTRKFGDFTAVDDVSFQIPAGSIFGFLGPNGAGKSTTIRMLLGILPITSGEGTVMGFDIRTQSVKIRSRVGYMSQKFSLYEDLTVAENLAFFGGIFGVAPDPALLETCRLTDHTGQLARDLPGGIRQRLAFAVSLIHNPDLVFLDEPTGAVDPAQRRYFWELIAGLAQQGKTVMVTTHYMDEVERCDQICFIHRGKRIAQGSPSELKREHLQGRMYRCEPPDRAQALQILQTLTQNPYASGAGVRFLVTGDISPVQAALNVPIEPADPTLEDVFISLAAA